MLGPESGAAGQARASLSDDEIAATAVFALPDTPGLTNEERAMAKIADFMHHNGRSPMSYVMWPTGVRAMITMHPGMRTGDSRLTLIRVYRAGEAGLLGAFATQVPCG